MSFRDDHGLKEGLFQLWREARAQKRWRRFWGLLLLFSLCIGISVLSFFLFEQGVREGEIAAAGNFFSRFLEENEAIAVFLGLD